MPYEALILEQRNKVAVITLNRPERLNALNTTLREELMQALRQVRDDDSVWAVVLTGAGRGFCSGADLVERPEPGQVEEGQTRAQRIDELNWFGRLSLMLYRDLNKPTIAAVNGVAAGAGMSLSLACDLRVGSELTRFKTVFLERSLSPDTGMSYYLPRIVGLSRAYDLVFTSRWVEAEEAYRIGLLDRLVPSERLLDAALELAEQIVALPPLAMQVAKRVLQHSLDSTIEEQLKYEAQGLQMARRAPNDAAEAAAAFRERRPAQFTGT
jgi:2-(1,2-epoxy-1,2-dihydrophenyl)acetyl-CoA isomerase